MWSLKATQTADECRIVSLNHHLTRNKDRYQSLLTVCQSKENESESGKWKKKNVHCFVLYLNCVFSEYEEECFVSGSYFW